MQQKRDEKSAAEFFSDWQSSDSAYAEHVAIEELRQVAWAQRLLQNLSGAKIAGDQQQLRGYIWEARIALSIHRLGYRAQYEHKAGEGGKSIDFRVKSSPELLIEAVAIQNSDASVQAGGREDAPGAVKFALSLVSTNPDQRQTTAGEMVRTVELLALKADKFPAVRAGVYHLLLADVRGYNAGIADLDDYDQIAMGPGAVHYDANRQFFGDKPVRGIFDLNNRRAMRAQQRIHGIGLFGGRKVGSLDVISTSVSIYRPNPSLLQSQEERDLIAGVLDGKPKTS